MLSLSIYKGIVHLPLPRYGAFWSITFTDTILWSVFKAVVSISQSTAVLIIFAEA
jgi:hypothetical protein